MGHLEIAPMVLVRRVNKTYKLCIWGKAAFEYCESRNPRFFWLFRIKKSCAVPPAIKLKFQ